MQFEEKEYRMDFEKIILNTLLDKYEASKALYETSNRRIILKMKNLTGYNIENYDRKQIIHDVIFELKKEGIIDFSWQIWLNKENVEWAYEKANRTNVKENIELLLKILEEAEFNQEWINEYKQNMINYLKEKHKTNNLFPVQFAQDILLVLKQIDNKEENLKRVLSIKCFGDSKYFERNIEHILIRIIKTYLLEKAEEYSNDDILLEVGISKYPEIFEFCGDMEYYIDDEKIEYKKETMGSYLNSYNVEKMTNLTIKNARKILFIENKANYIDYIQNKQESDEFVIYHGGMYSPLKGKFFKKIYEACENQEFYHWSDIDIGGFRIFTRLKKIIPELQEYKMDTEAFLAKKEYWKEMNQDYRKRLQQLRGSAEYETFYEVIDAMLENNSKLEQEAFIL